MQPTGRESAARGERSLVPSRRRTPLALAPAALVLLALAGCGGGTARTADATRTVTVAKTVTTPASTGTSSVTAHAHGGTATSTAPNPNAPLALHAAEQVLDARGYAVLTESDWRPDQPLKVLIGVSRGGGPRAELAFFFVGASFIGTDTKDPSGSIEVVAQGGDAVTLSYALYKPSDLIDAPTAGSASVTYRWTGSRLVPQGTIPSAAPAASPSRR